MEHIIVGKHTLESLTSGMYADPFVVYREYIQNAVDSLDSCIEAGRIESEEAKVNITVSSIERKITISDNGTGIASSQAEKTLISIGNSKKTSDTSRGFRGIGRLAALSYCDRLTFETSSFDENVGTKIVIDAKGLANRLAMDEAEDVTVVDVLQRVYTVEIYPEAPSKHYFNVILENVDESSKLLDVESVAAYLSQNAPVPYDPAKFIWGGEIKRRISKAGFSISEYDISLTYGTETHPVYKPYADIFLVDKGKAITDTIKDVEILILRDNEQQIVAFGWIGKTDYRGSIYDKSIKGIRLRKGNILIGDNQTMNVVFKDARFNGWSIGEIFVVDPCLIPNARRDSFEKNAEYFRLFEKLTTIAAGIVKDIRSASLARNAALANAVSQTEIAQGNVQNAIEEGISPSRKGTLKQNIAKAQLTLNMLPSQDDKEEYIKSIAFEELDMLIGRLQGATAFKALNTLEHLSKTEKRILEKVFNVIVATTPQESDSLIDAILSSFSK